MLNVKTRKIRFIYVDAFKYLIGGICFTLLPYNGFTGIWLHDTKDAFSFVAEYKCCVVAMLQISHYVWQQLL